SRWRPSQWRPVELTAAGSQNCDYITNSLLAFLTRFDYISHQSCSSEGRRPEAILKVERDCGVPRPWHANAGSGGSETARRALRPVLPGAGCTCFGGNAEAGNADPSRKSPRCGAPRGAASRSQGTPGRLASAPPASVIRGHRCLASTGRLSALP